MIDEVRSREPGRGYRSSNLKDSEIPMKHGLMLDQSPDHQRQKCTGLVIS